MSDEMKGDGRTPFSRYIFHGWNSLVNYYRHTICSLLILMTALESVVPCVCKSCESTVCCDACERQDSDIHCGHRHCHNVASTSGSDATTPHRENNSTQVCDRDSAPTAPVKSCSCLRCMTVGIESLRPPQRRNSATPFHAGNIEAAVPPSAVLNSLTFCFCNSVNRALSRERALVRLQV